MSGSEVAGLVRYDDASLDGLRSLSAMAESEDYASARRASGGEKLAGWEIKAPRKCAMVLRQHNSQNLLLCWAAPEFGLRRRGHSPLLMAFGRGGKTAMVVGIATCHSRSRSSKWGPGAHSYIARGCDDGVR